MAAAASTVAACNADHIPLTQSGNTDPATARLIALEADIKEGRIDAAITRLKAFVAAVLGGIGNIPGAVLGGLLIGAAETLVVGYGSYIGIPSTYRDAVAFAILILVLLIRPAGLLGANVQEKV